MPVTETTLTLLARLRDTMRLNDTGLVEVAVFIEDAWKGMLHLESHGEDYDMVHHMPMPETGIPLMGHSVWTRATPASSRWTVREISEEEYCLLLACMQPDPPIEDHRSPLPAPLVSALFLDQSLIDATEILARVGRGQIRLVGAGLENGRRASCGAEMVAFTGSAHLTRTSAESTDWTIRAVNHKEFSRLKLRIAPPDVPLDSMTCVLDDAAGAAR